MILNRIIRPPRQHLGNARPLALLLPIQQQEHPLLNFAPLALFVFGVQVVVPPLAAVLAVAIGEVLRDKCPLLRPTHLNQLQ